MCENFSASASTALIKACPKRSRRLHEKTPSVPGLVPVPHHQEYEIESHHKQRILCGEQEPKREAKVRDKRKKPNIRRAQQPLGLFEIRSILATAWNP